MNELISNILTAPVYDVAKKTPLDYFNQLSTELNNHIWVKREDLQPVFSFKCRGAYNKLIRLVNNNKSLKGVVAASAGNHAQGLALSANKLKIKATIVMPRITPQIKINAVKRFGGEFVDIVIHGDSFDDAAEKASQIQKEKDLAFVHPFNDLDVIAGQGTIGKELIEQQKDIDAIFIPIGGGGLIAGVSAYIKQLKPSIKIIGVEHVDSASMLASFKGESIITLDHVGVFADGVAVKRVGELTLALTKQYVDEIITVTTDEICASINNIFDQTRSIVEPSGAVALTGLKKWAKNNQISNQNLVAIVTGANMNFDSLRYVTERTALGAQKECLLGVFIPEEIGSFKKLCQLIQNRNVTEFNYRCNNREKAAIFMGVAIQNGQAEIDQLIQTLNDHNYKVSDFSNNDSAKLHIRYMIGGQINKKEEYLFRFSFPERPGALLHFLETLDTYNITLFHYRNHGSDYGRVLIGIDGLNDLESLTSKLDKVGYYYVNETENPAYSMFL